MQMNQTLLWTAALLLFQLVQALTVEKRVSKLLSWSKSEEGIHTVLGWCEERRQEGSPGHQVLVRWGDNEPLEVSIPTPNDDNSLARTLWPASLAAAILLKSPAAEQLVKNKHILELGCGLGLAGTVASKSAKSCCLTDHDEEVIQMLQELVANNPSIDARYLEWRDEERPSEIPLSDMVIGADVAYYFYLLRPLMDTTKAFLKPENSAFMIAGQANRESQWDLYHNIRDGCYNQLTDEKDAPWKGETRMLLYQLQLSKWHSVESSDDLELDGTLPIAVLLHTSPGLDNFAFTAFDHIASKDDEESMMISF